MKRSNSPPFVSVVLTSGASCFSGVFAKRGEKCTSLVGRKVVKGNFRKNGGLTKRRGPKETKMVAATDAWSIAGCPRPRLEARRHAWLEA